MVSLKKVFLCAAIPVGVFAGLVMFGTSSVYTFRAISAVIHSADIWASDLTSDNSQLLCGSRAERDEEAAAIIDTYYKNGGEGTSLTTDVNGYWDCDRLTLS